MAMETLTTRVDRLEDMMHELQRVVAENSRAIREAIERTEQHRREMDARAERDRREMDARAERDRKQFRREMAEITHSIGRMVEDLVAPSIPGVLAQVVGCEQLPQLEGVRIICRRNGRSKEYDAIAVCDDYLLITEVKTRLRSEYVSEFIAALEEARTFLTEYDDKQIIGALATFYVDESLVRSGERQGLIMLGVVDGLMHVLNGPDFTPRVW